MAARIKRAGWIAIGWALLTIGVLGLVLPVIPGFALLIPGLMMLSTEYTWAGNVLVWVRQRYPRMAERFDRSRGLPAPAK